MFCQKYDVNGDPVVDGTGSQIELSYSYVYMADLATNTSWIVTSKTEEVVGLDVIRNPNGNGSDVISISLASHNGSVRVMVIDPALQPTVQNPTNADFIAAKKISDKTYLVGNTN